VLGPGYRGTPSLEPSPTLHVRSVGTPRPFAELAQRHERLLRSGFPSVSVGVVGERTVSYGVGESDASPYLVRARADGVATARRASGGSGIVHLPGDLVWAVVLPRDDPRVGRDFVKAYDRFGAGLPLLLQRHGLSGAWVPAPGLCPEYCPLSARGWVLEVQGNVLAAAAQHLTGTTLLHHGTLPRGIDRSSIARWFDLPTPGPADRLTSLEELGARVSAVRLAGELADHLAEGLQSPTV
jgi:lipoate-protein ligase A